MDEPFSALDPLIRAKLQDELLALQDRLKRTILFVSHDLDEAFKLGNRIGIMEGGRIVQCGRPQDIFAKPADDYVADFVAHMNPLGVLRTIDAMEKPLQERYDQTVAADKLLAEILDDVAASHTPVGVIKQGTIVGQLTSRGVLSFLSGHVGEEA